MTKRTQQLESRRRSGVGVPSLAERHHTEVEYDPEAERWYVTVDGRPLDDARGKPLHWLDYSAAYAVKTGLDPAPAPLMGFALAGAEG